MPQQLETTLEADDGIIRTGRARGVRHSGSTPPRAQMNVRVSGIHGKAANRGKQLYGLTFTAGVALGPAVGGAPLATSPDAVWWGGALTVALIGAGLLRLGDRIPDPLLQAQCPRPQAVGAIGGHGCSTNTATSS